VPPVDIDDVSDFNLGVLFASSIEIHEIFLSRDNLRICNYGKTLRKMSLCWIMFTRKIR